MRWKKRKANRLKEYNYSRNGAYFVTICTKDKKHILSKIIGGVGEGLCALPQNQLTSIGIAVDKCINYITRKYININIDKYVIMPNHVHMIIKLKETCGHENSPLHKIIGELKSYATYKFKQQLWQRSFHDHIIRNENDYLKIWEYIDNNPLKWELDCYYK